MKNSSRLFLVASLLVAMGCSEKKNTANGSFTPTPATFSTNTPAAAGDTTGGNAGATAALNPPHGQPGHRCDIQVGAPLNGSPAQTPAASAGTVVSPTPTPVPVAAPTPVPAMPTATAPGMNPPHGQPGHDCSIAVGAPLKK
ncbi:hypothetical protein [Rufibacter sp. LB8]|uniref:hypothetical protein n=1 Tax=Rufibacter sp. LB8 TaxID=2777781 RepID=UPI00178C18A2|nr:hypothetical protein [Rufibacter sp. LB8]